MTIEEALEGIELTGKEQKPREDPTIQNKTQTEETMKEYIQGLKKMLETRRFPGSESMDAATKFAKYARFTPELNITFIDIPRTEIIEILKKEKPEMHKLITETDIIEYILDPFNPAKPSSYAGLPAFLDIKTIFEGDKLKECTKVKKMFTIPNINILSLFIEEGEKIREYAKTIKHQQQEDILRVYEYEDISRADRTQRLVELKNPTIFTLEGLNKFYDATKEKSLKKMIGQYQEFIDMISAIQRQNDKITTTENARIELFKRLNQYHPELVYTGGK